jgi:hypothetical protein
LLLDYLFDSFVHFEEDSGNLESNSWVFLEEGNNLFPDDAVEANSPNRDIDLSFPYPPAEPLDSDDSYNISAMDIMNMNDSILPGEPSSSPKPSNSTNSSKSKGHDSQPWTCSCGKSFSHRYKLKYVPQRSLTGLGKVNHDSVNTGDAIQSYSNVTSLRVVPEILDSQNLRTCSVIRPDIAG